MSVASGNLDWLPCLAWDGFTFLAYLGVSRIPYIVHADGQLRANAFHTIASAGGMGIEAVAYFPGLPNCLSAKSRKIFQSSLVIECLPGRM